MTELRETLLTHARLAYSTAGYLVQRQRAQAMAAARGVHRMRDLRFADHSRSRTLFVLGSGASINRITPEQWAFIAQHDSIGFNNWLVHEHTPTYFLFEQVDRRSPHFGAVSSAYAHNLNLARERYARVPILAASSEARPLDLSGFDPAITSNFHVLSTLTLQGQARDEVLQQVRALSLLGWFSPQPTYSISITKRASLFRILHFALLAGYERIVLCGIDLNNTAYFFQENPEHYTQQGYRLDHVAPLQTGAVHKTLDRSFGALTIDELIVLLRDQLLAPRGIALHVASDASALYPRIPLFDFARG